MSKKLDRIERATWQRIHVISSSDDDNTYRILGTQGNEYKVTIDESNWKHSTCSCPDFTRRRRLCKHVYYVLIKVKRMTQEQLEGGEGSSKAIEFYKPNEGDECAICYDGYKENEKATSCEKCAKPFHVTCIKAWKSHCEKTRVKVTCPLCRHKLTI